MARISRRWILAGGLASCASGAFAFSPQPARAQSVPTIRVAYQPYQYSAQVLYAQEMGFFTKAGINVELQSIALGSALAGGVASNAVDIGIATIATLALAHYKKIPFVLIAPAAEFSASAPPKAFLMVGNQTSIHTGKDMNGKTVGTPGLNTMGEYGVRAWVDANGGDAKTLKFVEMPTSQMPSAFASGRIDAASIGEPFVTDARKVARALPTSMEAVLGRNFLITAWFTTAAWAAAHPDLVARFVSAVNDATAWSAKNPTKCIEIIARTFQQDASTLSVSALATFGQRLTPALVTPEIAVTAKYANFPMFPAEELIYKP
jgi:NitT/TauT family transport system substrate-binding protein